VSSSTTTNPPESDDPTAPEAVGADGDALLHTLDTPAMRQFRRFKEAHPGCLLFFRMGDFYELFGQDAIVAHRALDITLTERTSGVPMAGVPHHAAEQYLRRLVEQGFRVAIADQIQDPKDAKGVVDRAVVRVVTPGTLVDEHLLDDAATNRIAAVAAAEDGPWAIATIEISTGAFTVVEVDAAEVPDRLARLRPQELLVPGDADGDAPGWPWLDDPSARPCPATVRDRGGPSNPPTPPPNCGNASAWPRSRASASTTAAPRPPPAARCFATPWRCPPATSGTPASPISSRPAPRPAPAASRWTRSRFEVSRSSGPCAAANGTAAW